MNSQKTCTIVWNSLRTVCQSQTAVFCIMANPKLNTKKYLSPWGILWSWCDYVWFTLAYQNSFKNAMVPNPDHAPESRSSLIFLKLWTCSLRNSIQLMMWELYVLQHHISPPHFNSHKFHSISGVALNNKATHVHKSHALFADKWDAATLIIFWVSAAFYLNKTGGSS